MAWAEAQHGEAKAGKMGATGLGVEDFVEEKNRSYGLTFRLDSLVYIDDFSLGLVVFVVCGASS